MKSSFRDSRRKINRDLTGKFNHVSFLIPKTAGNPNWFCPEDATDGTPKKSNGNSADEVFARDSRKCTGEVAAASAPRGGRVGLSQYWSNCLARAALIARRHPRISVAHQADDKRIKYLCNYRILDSRMWTAPGQASQAGEAVWHGYFSN